jgi:hypothetical protein
MAHGDDQHHDPFLLNFADDSVISDSVTPEALLEWRNGLPKLLGSSADAIRGSYSIVQAKVLSQLMCSDGCLPIL